MMQQESELKRGVVDLYFVDIHVEDGIGIVG